MPETQPIVGDRVVRAAEASPSAAFRCAGAFARGLLTPSGPAVVLAFLFIVVGLLWLCTVGSAPARIAASRPGDWMRNASDDYRRITVLTHQGLAPHRQPGRPLALFIGPSGLRELLPEKPELDAVLSEATGRDWASLVLCADTMAPAGSAAVAARLGADFEGWIVLGVNRHTFSTLAERNVIMARRLGFESAYIDEALGGEPSWVPLVFRRPAFFFGGMGGFQSLWRKPQPWRQHHFSAPVAMVDGHLANLNLPVDFAEADRQLAMLAKLARELRGGGGGKARLALVEFPFVDEFLPELQDRPWHAERRTYARRMERWARETGGVWWDLAPELSFTRVDYGDALHVRHAGARTAYVKALAARLVAEEEGTR